MKIAIGSTNPVKVAAVRQVFSRAFPAVEFAAQSVSSGVPDQPWGDDQTRQGALNRATAVLHRAGATLGVGLEGGLIETEAGLMTCAWCAVVDETGLVGWGGGVKMLLPPVVAQKIKEHGELGPAMDALIDRHNTKQGPGAVGILTNGLINRQSAYEQLVAMAAAPFVTGYYRGQAGTPSVQND